jgi:hypothetical protein
MGPAVLLTTVLLMLLGFVLAGDLRPLAGFRHFLWARHQDFLLFYFAVLTTNLFAASLLLLRALGLKTAGRKLAHLDSELRSDSAIAHELARIEDPNREDR